MSSDLSSNFLQVNLGMANGNGHKVYRFDEFSVDVEKLMLYRGESEITLAPKVVKTLVVLIESEGEILSKDQLIEAVWSDSVVEDSNLSQYLYLLRKTLGNRPDGAPYIETLRRRGYRFTGKVTYIEKSSAGGSTASRAEDGATRRFGVQRRGNVVALLDWKEPEEIPTSVAQANAEVSQAPPARVISKPLLAVAITVLLLTAGFAVYRLGAENVEEVKARGELISVRLTNGLVPIDATISPDGKYFVYHEIEGNLFRMWLQQTGHSTRVPVIPASERPLLAKTFSPDGHFIYFLAQEPSNSFYSLYRVPTLGGPAAKILDDISSNVSFSPDGREMVFYRHNPGTGVNAYVITSSDGAGGERIVHRWDDGRVSSGNPAWSPDGTVIVFTEISMTTEFPGRCSLVAIDPDSGKMRPFSGGEWLACYRIAWSPDGRGLYMIGTTEADFRSIRREAPYYISYPDGRSRRLTKDESRYQGYSLGVTNDGSVLVVPFNRYSQIWAMDPNGDSRSAVQLTSGLADGRAGIAPMADGRVAYVTRTGDTLNVWSMNPDGSDQKQLTVDPYFVEEVRASPDGRHLVFSGRHEPGQHLFRINSDGTDLRQLTFGDSFEIDSSVSFDGKWVVYDGRPSADKNWTLWKIPIDGGDPVPFGQTQCNRPHFSPDGRFITCIPASDREILILSAEDGTVVRSFAASPFTGLNFGAKWTPDGKGVVYIDAYDGKASNLWIQPIDGGPPKQLTDFATGTIYHFAYSLDGTRLFVARGQQIRDAVLMRGSLPVNL